MFVVGLLRSFETFFCFTTNKQLKTFVLSDKFFILYIVTYLLILFLIYYIIFYCFFLYFSLLFLRKLLFYFSLVKNMRKHCYFAESLRSKNLAKYKFYAYFYTTYLILGGFFMTFTSLIHFIAYSSGLPPDFRCVFVILYKNSDLCSLQDLRNGSYYATRYFSLSYQFELVQFTYVSDELIFILKEN